MDLDAEHRQLVTERTDIDGAVSATCGGELAHSPTSLLDRHRAGVGEPIRRCSRSRTPLIRRFACLIMMLTMAGCATTRAPLGEPLRVLDSAAGYRAATVLARRPNDDVLLIMSFSGGGIRSSAFAYGVLEQLAEDTFEHDGRRVRVLDEIDMLSAVSGGSIPAAYLALYGDRLFQDFEARFLSQDLAAGFRRSMLWNPHNWWRLASPEFSRGDLYAEYLNQKLFPGATFADLDRSGRRPFLLINATDIGLAGRFDFTQDTFDLLCNDLDAYSISRAVAASTGIPALLTPITLHNHAGECGYRLPAWVDEAIAKAGRGSREYFRASILRGRSDATRYPYLHLLDGSLSDNLGVRSALDALSDGARTVELQKMLSPGRIRKIVFIVVNAANSQAERVGGRRKPPDTVEMLRLLGTVPMDRYAVESRVVLRETLSRWTRQLGLEEADSALHLIEVDLDALSGTRHVRLVNLPTTLSAPRADLDELRCAARWLLGQSSEYQRLLRESGGRLTTSSKCPSF